MTCYNITRVSLKGVHKTYDHHYITLVVKELVRFHISHISCIIHELFRETVAFNEYPIFLAFVCFSVLRVNKA